MPPTRRRPPKKTFREDSEENVLLDADHTPPVSPLTGEEPAEVARQAVDTVAEPSEAEIEALARLLPVPDGTTTDEAEPVTADQEVESQRCERIVKFAQAMWWVRGQALQITRDRRYYKRIHGYPSFDAFLEAEWDISRQEATRQIQAWPIARRLWSVNDRLNERQIRALLPLVDQYGLDAAATVYETTMAALQVHGRKISGALLEPVGEAVQAALPGDAFDATAASAAIEAAVQELAAGPKVIPPPRDPIADAVTKGITRLTSIGNRVAQHATENPEQARAFASELRAIAARVEESLGTAD